MQLQYLNNAAIAAYYFICYDIITFIMPLVSFSAAVTHVNSVQRLFISFAWTALHVLSFCTSNQLLSVEEDSKNKKWRPLPSGRISYSATVKLRWSLIPLCLFVSIPFNALAPSALFLAATIVYNEGGLHSHWLAKNVMNMIGYGAGALGTLVISDGNHKLTSQALIPWLKVCLVILTTIHASDFPDVIGDKIVGRYTLPIIYPLTARYSLAASLVLWSLYDLCYRQILDLASCLPLGGIAVALRFLVFTTPQQDKPSADAYYIWLMLMLLSTALAA